MANHSFRAACWALITAFALSVCALCSDPEQVRLALLAPPPTAPPGVGDGSEATLLAHTLPTDPQIPVAEPWDGDQLASRTADTAEPLVPESGAPNGSPLSATLPDSATPWFDPFPVAEVPVREASSTTASELPWLVQGSVPVTHRTRYEELPSPQETNPDAATVPAADAQKFDELLTRLDDLRGEMDALRDNHQSVQHALQTLATTAEQQQPRDVRLQVWTFDVPRTGTFQSGFVPALQRSAELRTVRGAAGASTVSFVWTDSEGTPFWRWLQRQPPVTEIDARTMQLAQHAITEVALPANQRPRIEHVRGTHVTQPGRAADSAVRYEIRVSSPAPTLIDVEFRPSDSAGADWLRASVPSDAVLVIEPLSARAVTDAQPDKSGSPRNPRRSTVIVLQPALVDPTSVSRPTATLPELAPPLFP